MGEMAEFAGVLEALDAQILVIAEVKDSVLRGRAEKIREVTHLAEESTQKLNAIACSLENIKELLRTGAQPGTAFEAEVLAYVRANRELPALHSFSVRKPLIQGEFLGVQQKPLPNVCDEADYIVTFPRKFSNKVQVLNCHTQCSEEHAITLIPEFRPLGVWCVLPYLRLFYSSVEHNVLINLRTNSGQVMPRAHERRIAPGCEFCQGHVYLFGGRGSAGLRSAEKLSLTDLNWHQISQLTEPREMVTAKRVQQKVFIISEGSVHIEEYSPELDQYRVLGLILPLRVQGNLLSVDDRLIVLQKDSGTVVDIENERVISEFAIPNEDWWGGLSSVSYNGSGYIVRDNDDSAWVFSLADCSLSPLQQ